MATTITDIRNATTTKELETIVNGYLVELGEFDTARKECESWGDTAARLGGDSRRGTNTCSSTDLERKSKHACRRSNS